MSITSDLREKLAAVNLNMDRFRELTLRLLTYGTLVRDEDRTEQLLYDDARRIESLLSEYFEIAGLLLHHDLNAQFFRLYGPGAVVDGLPEDPLNPIPSMKVRVSNDFVVCAIALRFLYQAKLNQGLIDTQAEAMISFEDLAAAITSQLKRQLPDNDLDRLAVLAELKRHRLLRFSSTFSVKDPDAYLAIRPTILGIVSNDALSAALDADGSIEIVNQVEESAE